MGPAGKSPSPAAAAWHRTGSKGSSFVGGFSTRSASWRPAASVPAPKAAAFAKAKSLPPPPPNPQAEQAPAIAFLLRHGCEQFSGGTWRDKDGNVQRALNWDFAVTFLNTASVGLLSKRGKRHCLLLRGYKGDLGVILGLYLSYSSWLEGMISRIVGCLGAL